MNPWPFVLAAYAVTAGGTLGLLLWSVGSMRRAEASADAQQRK